MSVFFFFKLNICFTTSSMCFTYVIEILIVCLCSFDFLVSSDKVCQLKFFLSGFNHTEDFIAMHRKRNVSILLFLSEYPIFARWMGQFWRHFFFWAASSRWHSPDAKVKAVCQSLINLLRGTTYGLWVSASFLRSAPRPAGGRPQAARAP